MQQNYQPGDVMPLLSPSYPEQYYNLFMKVKIKIEAQEYTRELNDMIQKLIVFGETNYTCWIAKKRIIEAGQISIQEEDNYCEQLLMDNLKNFQIWDYRNYIFQNTRNCERQYQIMDRILEESPKNYHLWSNRVKVVDYSGEYQAEIQRTQKYIHRDPYNNSPWAYRFHCYNKLYFETTKDHHDQIKWVSFQIIKHIDNQAAWNYLKGFFPSHKTSFNGQNKQKSEKIVRLKFEDYPEIQELCLQIIKEENVPAKKKSLAILTLSIINTQQPTRIQFAKQNLDMLIQLEPLHQNYYKWLKSVI